MVDDRQYAPATLRNRDFILDRLRDVLPRNGVILEIASGSGEHIVHFARNFPAPMDLRHPWADRGHCASTRMMSAVAPTPDLPCSTDEAD